MSEGLSSLFVNQLVLPAGSARARKETPMEPKEARGDGYILNRKTGIVHRADCRTLPRLPWLPYGTTWVEAVAIDSLRSCQHCIIAKPDRLHGPGFRWLGS